MVEYSPLSTLEILQEQICGSTSCESFNGFISNLIDSVLNETGVLSTELNSEALKRLLVNPTFLKKFLKVYFGQCRKFTFDEKLKESTVKIIKLLTTLCPEICLQCLWQVFIDESDQMTLKCIEEYVAFLIDCNHLETLLWLQSKQTPTRIVNNQYVFKPHVKILWLDLLKILASLPDVVANKMKWNKISQVLTLDGYFTQLIAAVRSTMLRIHQSLANGVECSICFLSDLVAKICATGKAVLFYTLMLPSFREWCRKSPLWRRICGKLFSSIGDVWLEPVVEPLLKHSQCNAEMLEDLFACAVLTREKLKFLLTFKFLFVRVFAEDKVPICVLRYLSKSHQLEVLFKQVLFQALETWSSASSMRHSPFQQHLYITKILLVSVSYLNDDQKKSWKSDLVSRMMEGIQAHFESPAKKLNEIGMLVGECITRVVDQNGKQLKFDLDRDELMMYLWDLSIDPDTAMDKASTSIVEIDEENNKTGPIVQEDSGGLDSDDDDLEPINIDSEFVNGVRGPVYLRDCIAGLVSSEDMDRKEACLNALERLVKQQPSDLDDVCVELTRILLHMDEEGSISNFSRTRKNCLVALAVNCPAKVSVYLAEQFYTDDYCINQRLLVLEVIGCGAMELSKPVSEDPEKYKSHLPLAACSEKIDLPAWKVIVDRRVQQKTRKFASCTKNATLTAKPNRLSTVAGCFFFPLLSKFGRKLNTCDMLGKDNCVLVLFIDTLSTVILASSKLPVTVSMGKHMLALIWSLRFHEEKLVRRSLLHAFHALLLSVPSDGMAIGLHEDICEAKEWLQDSLASELDGLCLQLANVCLQRLEIRD